MITGGAAEKSGQLHAGDHLLAVNGTDVSCMSRIEAWGLMKRLAPGQVTLLVRPQQ
jgi:C-terminal processing protease CtpA/Prc